MKLGEFALAALLAGTVTACLQAPSRFPDTALFAGLSRDYEAGQRQLQSRIEVRFRPGGPEAGLEDYLRSQGMKTRRIANVDGVGSIYGESRARQGIGACDSVAMISWRAGAAGVLSEVLVTYSDTGCF